jgi:hypothetical protein
VRLVRRSQSFDGGDLVTSYCRHWRIAAVHRMTIHQHRAGAAGSSTATEARALELHVITQHKEQHRAGVGLGAGVAPIDPKGNRMRGHLNAVLKAWLTVGSGVTSTTEARRARGSLACERCQRVSVARCFAACRVVLSLSDGNSVAPTGGSQEGASSFRVPRQRAVEVLG